jgi:hypothetical protein
MQRLLNNHVKELILPSYLFALILLQGKSQKLEFLFSKAGQRNKNTTLMPVIKPKTVAVMFPCLPI